MVTLEVRDYSSGDIPQIWAWRPVRAEEVYFQLTIEVGEVGDEGGNDFQLVVATLEGLRAFADRFRDHEFPDRNILIFRTYSWSSLQSRIDRILKECARKTWAETMIALQRFFRWEYENYDTR